MFGVAVTHETERRERRPKAQVVETHARYRTAWMPSPCVMAITKTTAIATSTKPKSANRPIQAGHPRMHPYRVERPPDGYRGGRTTT